MDSRQTQLIYEFGDFELDAHRRVLTSRQAGEPLAVTGRVFDLLTYMVERAGQLLDKSTLMKALWPDVVVEEANLTQTIHTLRKVLGESPGEHRYIVTVAGRGYQFVASVRTRTASGAENVSAEAPGEPARPTVRRWPLFAALGLLVAALGIVIFFTQWRAAPGDRPLPSIAVLPFVDMSPEKNQEYFSDGLSEEILNLLAQSQSLRVIARTSSFSFKGGRADVATIAEKLHVSHVLEGSVRKSGNRIRVTAQLVDAANSAHLWSQTYDRDLKDVIAVQSDIAAAVAESLEIKLHVNTLPAHVETNSAQALESYLQGRYFLNRRGTGDLERAREYFQEALRTDPGNARAWVGVATTYYFSEDANKAIPEQVLGKWREAIEHALALDPNLVEVQVRAAQYYIVTGDAQKAHEHQQRAEVLGPSDPLVLGSGITTNDIDGTISLLRRILSVDPLSVANRINLGGFLVAAGRYEEAKPEITLALEMSPTKTDLQAELVRILILQQRYGEALTAAQKLPDSHYRNESLALIAHATGNAASADAELAHLIRLADVPGSVAEVKLAIAEVYAFRGMHDEAFRWLELLSRQTYDARLIAAPAWWTQQELPLSPFLKPLHGDPRWQRVVDGVGASTEPKS